MNQLENMYFMLMVLTYREYRNDMAGLSLEMEPIPYDKWLKSQVTVLSEIAAEWEKRAGGTE